MNESIERPLYIDMESLFFSTLLIMFIKAFVQTPGGWLIFTVPMDEMRGPPLPMCSKNK